MGILLTLSLVGLPDGYLVWVQGEVGNPANRRIVRMALPDKSDLRVLTTGEDVEAQVSPDGGWVAHAKAKLPGGTDYHVFARWKIEECFVAPNGSWIAARTRGSDTFEEYGVNAYMVAPASHVRVGWTERRHGCQPYVALSGDWVDHAGEYEGIKWGDAPHIASRQVNQTLRRLEVIDWARIGAGRG
jgi:hypothetical protein